MIEELGILVVAPALSMLTAGMIAWASKTLLQVSKIQQNLQYRVDENENAIDELKKNMG